MIIVALLSQTAALQVSRAAVGAPLSLARPVVYTDQSGHIITLKSDWCLVCLLWGHYTNGPHINTHTQTVHSVQRLSPIHKQGQRNQSSRPSSCWANLAAIWPHPTITTPTISCDPDQKEMSFWWVLKYPLIWTLVLCHVHAIMQSLSVSELRVFINSICIHKQYSIWFEAPSVTNRSPHTKKI